MIRKICVTMLAAALSCASSHAQEKELAPTRRILAVGGGGFHEGDRALAKYFIALTGKKDPVIYYLPTATGDSERWIVDWYEHMNTLDCRPRHQRLLLIDSYRTKNLETTLLSADAIYVGGGNTLNMLAIWKLHGVDKILRKAYDRGILLGGESAGMICWFEQGCTDSRVGKLSAMECLGFLKGSACPHYHVEAMRQSAYHSMIRNGELKDGIACSDFAALLYENEKLTRVLGVRSFGGGQFGDGQFGGGPFGAHACYVRRRDGKVVEEQIAVESVPALPTVVNIWPGKPAGDVGIASAEKFFQLMVKGKPHEVDGKPTKWLTNVSTPTLTIYRPHKRKNTGVAMLIAPGGGYHNLGWDVEGEEIAEWLNSIGITGIILKYRCPRRPGDEKGAPPIGPLKDAQRAVSLVRSRAKEWGINPDRIGMVGFSAGGHLVGATCTNFEERRYEPIDVVDEVSCRPDFGIMCYSGYFKVEGGFTLTVKTLKGTPPLFFVHATDDPISDAEHSVAFYQALRRAKIDAELHLYETGGHGFGVRRGSPCHAWTRSCEAWLRTHGFLKAAARE